MYFSISYAIAFMFGDIPQARLATQEAKLLSLDPLFRIELELLTGACGASGQTKLKEVFMDILPSESKAVEPQVAIQKANVLQASRLWGMVGSQAQGLIRAGMGMINDIYQGESPKLPEGACAWLVEVYSRLPWFATATKQIKGQDGVGVKKLIFGKDAVVHAWEMIQDKDASELSLQDPHYIPVFMLVCNCSPTI